MVSLTYNTLHNTNLKKLELDNSTTPGKIYAPLINIFKINCLPTISDFFLIENPITAVNHRAFRSFLCTFMDKKMSGKICPTTFINRHITRFVSKTIGLISSQKILYN